SLNYYLRDQSQMVLSEMAITMDEDQTEDAKHGTRQTDDPESAWDFCRAYTPWFGEQNSKDRSLCMGLIDVNGVGNLNQKHTNGFVDRLLAGVGQQLTVSVRKIESDARCFRVSGQTFALLLRDVDGQAAIVMMDRFRQAITDSTFLLDGQKVKTKVNTATLEIDPDESVLDALQRVEMTMTHAKEVGPDQNAIMMNGMVTVVEAQRENPTENLVQL
ncbi:MAG: diguanylate cyclase, partial [Planctomycetota bacterium]|nr:diguanylate cyclase [Planctomycetota bacterium]